MDKKKEYMDQLLHAVQQLDEKVGTAEQDDTLSFSFFNESFDQLGQITSLLHRLQSLQINDMKEQMQKLLLLLSERAEPERGGSCGSGDYSRCGGDIRGRNNSFVGSHHTI